MAIGIFWLLPLLCWLVASAYEAWQATTQKRKQGKNPLRRRLNAQPKSNHKGPCCP